MAPAVNVEVVKDQPGFRIGIIENHIISEGCGYIGIPKEPVHFNVIECDVGDAILIEVYNNVGMYSI